MVTDDELHGIKRMRASGHTHQEIADRLNLKRSTVAYQLKKLKDQPEDPSIEMIFASNFTPKETLIEFDVHSFERHRINNTLYTTGVEIYEMRQGVIHKTSMRHGFKGEDYPKLVTLIQKYGRDWYRNFDLTRREISILRGLVNSTFNIDWLYSRNEDVKRKWEFLGFGELSDFRMFTMTYAADAYKDALSGFPNIPHTLDPAMAHEYVDLVRKGTLRGGWRPNKNRSTWSVPDTVDNRIEILSYLNENNLQYHDLEEALLRRVEEQIRSLIEELSFEYLFEGTPWDGRDPAHAGAPEAYHKNRRNNVRKTINDRMEKQMPNVLIEYYKEKGIKKKDIPKLSMEPNPSGWPPEINHDD
tara:strand:+ start:162 stop:1235 length:1074 start_codon:yes stop_codon:yes gene_type:complete